MRVWRIRFSTNVERVALALGHKGLEVEWVDVEPGDRSEVERVSGQPLVPVLDETRARASRTRPRSRSPSSAASRSRRSTRAIRRAVPRRGSSSTGSTVSGSGRRTRSSTSSGARSDAARIGDDEPFHRILAERLPVDADPRVAAWLRRVDGRPRA